jgi:hypothetical protein
VGRIASMCSGRDSLDGSSRERLVSEDEIRAEIYSHTDHFHVEGEQPVFPANRDERNILPAFNITTVAETRSRNIEPQRATFRQEIISNVAPLSAMIRGQPRMGVARAAFEVKHTK